MNGNANMLLMWVFGEGAELVDTLADHEVLQGAALLLRFSIHYTAACPRTLVHSYTVCPRSLDPVYLVTYNYTMGQNFLEQTVPSKLLEMDMIYWTYSRYI